MDFEPTLQTVVQDNSRGFVGRALMQANLLFAVVVGICVFADSRSAVLAIVAATIFYLVGNNLGLAIVTGTVTATIVAWLEQRTTQKLNRMQFEVYKMQMLANKMQGEFVSLDATTPVMEPLPTPMANERFVAAVDVSVAKEAEQWALRLYGADGQPNPDKVNIGSRKEPDGRLKVPMPHSSPVREFLLTKRVLEKIDNGYRLRVDRYATAFRIRDLCGFYTV